MADQQGPGGSNDYLASRHPVRGLCQLSSSHTDSVQYVVEGLRSVLWGKAFEISTLGSRQATRQQFLLGRRVNLVVMTLLT
ncbi:hypothetical protein MKX08_008864 [Trichoderma sp. CBMAI-0020]|nr:hypothetical protein MKX08_008864 [Trichoderma sp. CBMAI-0020]